jgi:hypothetical protein
LDLRAFLRLDLIVLYIPHGKFKEARVFFT